MKLIFKTLSVLFIIGLTSCASSLVVQSDSDNQYDLSLYKTFSVISPSLDDKDELISINPILIQRISRSLNTSLTQKGLKQSNESDLVVKFFLGTQREVERSTDLGGFGYYGHRYFDSRDQRYIRSEKDEISIRFHDAKTNDVVWYAFTRFKRPSDQYDQSGINSLIAEVISSFN
jgi:hypothetical protein|tara:strand:- start:152 stop:676 length:525 start_codon:yes stop_codon:yes gene_type:complete